MTQKERIQVKWEGPALQDKLIDVRDLAPSLLALGDLCVAANHAINGDKSEIKVLISAEPDQSSFVIDIHFYMEALEAARTLLTLGSEGAKSLKEILEWIDLLSPYVKGAVGGATTSGGLIALYKQLKGKNVIGASQVDVGDSTGPVVISVENSGQMENINISPVVYKLATNDKVVDALHRFTAPITDDNGIDSVSFTSDDGVPNRLSNLDIDPQLLGGPLIEEDDPDDEVNINTVSKWCKLISPVFDKNAEKWRFEIGGIRHYVDISDTDIVADAVRKGQVGVEDLYKLQLEETETLKSSGKTTTAFKALQVLDFKASPKQTSFI